MLPQFLVPETTVKSNGSGLPVPLGPAQGQIIQITLLIDRVIEQESLELHIEGSSGGDQWLDHPVMHLPQKFYCGSYTYYCDLSRFPEVTHLRATWKAHRWGRGDLTPLFSFCLMAEPARSMAMSASG